MSEHSRLRFGWLRFMYVYTALGAGLFGLGLLVSPEVVKEILQWPVEEPVTRGIVGSLYVAFGVVSLLGLRSPLKFVPVLLLQLLYKSIWLITVAVPLALADRLPHHAMLAAIVFATYVVGDAIAIPFSYVFAEKLGQE